MHFRLDRLYVGFLILIHAVENAILIVIDTVIIIAQCMGKGDSPRTRELGALPSNISFRARHKSSERGLRAQSHSDSESLNPGRAMVRVAGAGSSVR
jgi:hypothetical protein